MARCPTGFRSGSTPRSASRSTQVSSAGHPRPPAEGWAQADQILAQHAGLRLFARAAVGRDHLCPDRGQQSGVGSARVGCPPGVRRSHGPTGTEGPQPSLTARCGQSGVCHMTVHDARRTCATLLVDVEVHRAGDRGDPALRRRFDDVGVLFERQPERLAQGCARWWEPLRGLLCPFLQG